LVRNWFSVYGWIYGFSVVGSDDLAIWQAPGARGVVEQPGPVDDHERVAALAAELGRPPVALLRDGPQAGHPARDHHRVGCPLEPPPRPPARNWPPAQRATRPPPRPATRPPPRPPARNWPPRPPSLPLAASLPLPLPYTAQHCTTQHSTAQHNFRLNLRFRWVSPAFVSCHTLSRPAVVGRHQGGALGGWWRPHPGPPTTSPPQARNPAPTTRILAHQTSSEV
jgi:hypothetical protein